MNCANHPQNSVSAYCRTCGKPLCPNCTRQVMGVIYCENCLAERVAGTASATPPPYPPAMGYAPQGQPAGGANPAIAGILAGFFPFGVGAVYCGQYAKGLAHLIVFVLLIVGQATTHIGMMHVVLGISIGAFYFYQLLDAIKSAKALQMGQPAPDPLGLNSMFSPGDRVDFSRGVPIGAVVLIGLGVLFLLHNLNIPYLEMDRIWPVFLIFLGVWLFVKRKTTADCRSRSVAGPAILVTIGVLWLVDNLNGPGWDRTWPVILLVVGIIKLMERGYLGGPPAPPLGPTSNALTGEPAGTEAGSEVKNG
jgi:hypothetical protein